MKVYEPVRTFEELTNSQLVAENQTEIQSFESTQIEPTITVSPLRGEALTVPIFSLPEHEERTEVLQLVNSDTAPIGASLGVQANSEEVNISTYQLDNSPPTNPYDLEVITDRHNVDVGEYSSTIENLFEGEKLQAPEVYEVLVTPEQYAAATNTLERVIEVQDLSEPQIESVLATVTALPETVQFTLAEVLETAEPEVIEETSNLLVKIAVAADRLNVLTLANFEQSSEAEQIEVLIKEWFEDLLNVIGIKDENERTLLIQEYLLNVKSHNYKHSTLKIMAEEIVDESTIENRYGFLGMAYGISDTLRQRFSVMLGRVVLSSH